MYKRCSVNDAGAKFNMKQSLKPTDLQHSRQSPAEHGPLEDHTGSLHQHHPLHPGAVSLLPLTTETASHKETAALSNTALCTIYQTSITYVTMHNI